MNNARNPWSVVHEMLHPASGSPAMEVRLTQVHDELNLTGGYSRVGKVVTISPAANDSPWLAVTS